MASGKTDRKANSKRVSGKYKPKGRKNVKVSKNFVLKVRKATDVAKIRGHYQSNEQTTLNPTLINQQTVYQNIPTSATNASAQGTNGLFSAVRILHAASRCWNFKTAATDPSLGGGGANALNLNKTTTVIDVRKQWWVLNYRNNTARTMYIKVFKCAPKNLDGINTAQGAWGNAIATGIGAAYIIGTPAVSVNTLHTSPKMYKEFNVHYKCEEDHLTIEPGQSHVMTIQGPSMEYDMKKFFIGTEYQEYQKQDVFLMHAVYTDLIGVNSSTLVQRAPLDPAVGELIVEARNYIEMSMPETVGWQSGGIAPAPGAVQNINRVMRFVVDDFTDKTSVAILSTAQDRTDMENPL